MGQRFVPITITVEDRQAEAKVKGLSNAFDELDQSANKASIVNIDSSYWRRGGIRVRSSCSCQPGCRAGFGRSRSGGRNGERWPDTIRMVSQCGKRDD